MIYGFILAYALAWPTEYMHYKHEQARCRLQNRCRLHRSIICALRVCERPA
jgi:hypothetical protein